MRRAAVPVGSTWYLVDCVEGAWGLRYGIVTRADGEAITLAQDGLSVPVGRAALEAAYARTAEQAWERAELAAADRLAAVQRARRAWYRSLK